MCWPIPPMSWSSRRPGETPAACAAPPGCGEGVKPPFCWLLLLALVGRKEDNFRALALDGELAVVDEQLAADAVLEEQEAQLVHRHRVLVVRGRLEVGDGDGPCRQPVGPLRGATVCI